MKEKQILSKKLILEALKKYRGLFNKSPDDTALDTYAEMLCAEFEFKQVTWALSEFIKSGSPFFPSCGEIFSQLKPKDVSAKEIGDFVANEIIQKVIDLGCYRLGEVFDSLSDVSKKTLGENRYLLLEIANSDSDQLPAIRAQIRDMAKSASEIHKQTVRNENLQRVGIKSSGSISFKTMDYSNFLPEQT